MKGFYKWKVHFIFLYSLDFMLQDLVSARGNPQLLVHFSQKVFFVLKTCYKLPDIFMEHSISILHPCFFHDSVISSQFISTNKSLKYLSRCVVGNAVFVTAKVSICLSVCLSVHAWIVTKLTKVLPTFLHHTKGKFMYFFGHRMIGGGRPFYLKFWVSDACSFKNDDFPSIFARSGSIVAPSEKKFTYD